MANNSILAAHMMHSLFSMFVLSFLRYTVVQVFSMYFVAQNAALNGVSLSPTVTVVHNSMSDYESSQTVNTGLALSMETAGGTKHCLSCSDALLGGGGSAC